MSEGPEREKPEWKYVVLLTNEQQTNYVRTEYEGVTFGEARAARDKLELETGHKVLVLPCVDFPRVQDGKSEA